MIESEREKETETHRETEREGGRERGREREGEGEGEGERCFLLLCTQYSTLVRNIFLLVFLIHFDPFRMIDC